MKPHSKDLRRGRFSELGRAYHVTATTSGRAPVFADLYAARALIRCLRTSDEQGRSSTYAFVVMPDHLHWLFALELGTLEKVVGGVKSVAAHRLGEHIWQPGYHDHALRKEEGLRAIGRYIVANPVRAGLVDRIGDYPHWDAIWL